MSIVLFFVGGIVGYVVIGYVEIGGVWCMVIFIIDGMGSL